MSMQAFHRKCPCLLAGLVLVLAVTGLQQAVADQPPTGPVAPEQLLEQLRGGGLLIYMRHAKTDRNQLDQDRSDLSRCVMQRNLSQEGREQARVIGAAIRTLGIPIGRVRSSPYCRCRDTAQLAFGKVEVEHKLRFGMGSDREETEELSRALKVMLSSAPQAGQNDVLVSHTANLKEATGIWPKPEGAAYVFMPSADTGFQYLGRIGPEQWRQLITQ